LTQSQQLFDDIDQCTEQLMHDAKIPGLVIAVTDRQQTLGISTYGLADIAAQIPISPETLFEIGSLGKPFTSIALLQLRDQGVLDLHAPVAQYLPWFEVQSEYPPITAHHLMNHTAGIVRGTAVAGIALIGSALEGYVLGIGAIARSASGWAARLLLFAGGLMMAMPGGGELGLSHVQLSFGGLALAAAGAGLVWLSARRR
jgi:hypothetical protein